MMRALNCEEFIFISPEKISIHVKMESLQRGLQSLIVSCRVPSTFGSTLHRWYCLPSPELDAFVILGVLDSS